MCLPRLSPTTCTCRFGLAPATSISSSNMDIARLAAVSPSLSFVFVITEKVAAGTSHVFHLFTRARSCGHRGQNLTPDRPSQHNRLRGAAVFVCAPVSRYLRYIGPCCHGPGYSALLSLHQASSACFSCVQHRQTPCSVTLSARGGLALPLA